MKTLNDVVELLKKKGYEAELELNSTILIANVKYHDLNIHKPTQLYRWTLAYFGVHTLIYYGCKQYDEYDRDIQLLYDWINTIPDRNDLKPCWNPESIPNPFGMPIIDDRDHSSMYPVKHVTYDCLPWYNGECSSSIVESISDSDGNLDVDAAKAKFGSCKKALKAVIKAYNAESKSMASLFAAKEKMNQRNKGYGE